MSHVALVIPGLDRIGGAERQVMLLAKGLRRRDWRVSVVALSGVGSRAAGELKPLESSSCAWKCAKDWPIRADGFVTTAGSTGRNHR
jgi:hypothetical protein